MMISAIPQLSDEELMDEYLKTVVLLDALEQELVKRGEKIVTRAESYRQMSSISQMLKEVKR